MTKTDEFVFLSYAREDGALARRLYEDLRYNGVDVWFDQETILPGQRWKDAIADGIRSARYVIPLLSTRSVNKVGVVQAEVRRALDELTNYPPNQIFVVPARLDECTPTHLELRELNWVDLFPEWEAGLDRILRVIGRRAALEYVFVPFASGRGHIWKPRLPVRFQRHDNPALSLLVADADIVTRPERSIIPRDQVCRLGFEHQSVESMPLQLDIFLTDPLFDGEYLLAESVPVDVSEALLHPVLGSDILSRLRITIDYGTKSTRVQHQSWNDWRQFESRQGAT